MASTAQLAKRVTSLETAFQTERQEQERDRTLAKLKLLTPTERQERMRILAERIVRHRRIEPEPGENTIQAAARCLRNLRLRRTY